MRLLLNANEGECEKFWVYIEKALGVYKSPLLFSFEYSEEDLGSSSDYYCCLCSYRVVKVTGSKQHINGQ